ncbi:MAG: GtrA family protein [Tannerellaceae bacterium]|jgi:putative flippase GtrA|nr:GtrA family protein [Tannerellaceae bacterium]
MKKKLQACFVDETNKVLTQLLRYTFVGGFAFAIDFGLLWFFTEILDFYYILSASISFVAGLFVNYFISTKWVFNKGKVLNKKLEFIYFGLIGAVGLILNDVLIWVLTDFVSVNYLVSKIITAILIYLWNFFARKYFLF